MSRSATWPVIGADSMNASAVIAEDKPVAAPVHAIGMALRSGSRVRPPTSVAAIAAPMTVAPSTCQTSVDHPSALVQLSFLALERGDRRRQERGERDRRHGTEHGEYGRARGLPRQRDRHRLQRVRRSLADGDERDEDHPVEHLAHAVAT